jgi:hypothetical protein
LLLIKNINQDSTRWVDADYLLLEWRHNDDGYSYRC